MLRQKDSDTKCRIMELLQRQNLVKFHYISAHRRNQAAYFAFLKLGARAESAVPALMDIYELKISPFSQQATARSLGHIGPTAKRAIPLLIRGMADTNTLVRCDTLMALADFHAEPQLVVPALTNALGDSDARVRLFACTALQGMADATKVRNPDEGWMEKSVPALVHSLVDSDVQVRRFAADVLRQIDPASLTNSAVP
jgi:HEAT repeat protein